MSQKYVIVHFVNLPTVPEEFPMSEWPLHVTLLANFRIEQLDTFKDKLMDYTRQCKAFDITTNCEALFGPDQSVAVSLIQPDEKITMLHTVLLSLATSLGAEFDEPAFTGDGFRPHATIQHKSRLQDKQTIRLDSLTLIDMYPNADIKKRRVIETYLLGG